MTSEARESTATTARAASLFQIVYAIILVGAGLLAAFVLLYGITHVQSSGGVLWALVGLVAYLAVWGWGILLAKSY